MIGCASIGCSADYRHDDEIFSGARIERDGCRFVAWVGQTLQHQVDLLSYVDVFRTLAAHQRDQGAD